MIRQNEPHSNGDARVHKADSMSIANIPPSTIYHGTTPMPDVGYHGLKDYAIQLERGVSGSESPEAHTDRMLKMGNLLIDQLADTSIDLKHAYDRALDTLSSELREKDWGFSVSNGELTLWENTDKLSESEQATIKEALSSFNVEFLANNVANTVVAGLAAARGPYDVTHNIGRYDLTQSNFGEVIDLRAYVTSHTEGGKYEARTEQLSNIRSDRFLYYNTGLMAMIDQLTARADPRYARQ